MRRPHRHTHRDCFAAAPPDAVVRRPYTHGAPAGRRTRLDHRAQRVLAVRLRVERRRDAKLIQPGKVHRHVELLPRPFQLPPVGIAQRGRPDAPSRRRIAGLDLEGNRLAGRPHQARNLGRHPLVVGANDPFLSAGGEVVDLKQLGGHRALDDEFIAENADGGYGSYRQVDRALGLAGRGESFQCRAGQGVHRTGLVHGEQARYFPRPPHRAVESDTPQCAVLGVEIERLDGLADTEVPGLRLLLNRVHLQHLAGGTDAQDAEPVLVEAVEIAAGPRLDARGASQPALSLTRNSLQAANCLKFRS